MSTPWLAWPRAAASALLARGLAVAAALLLLASPALAHKASDSYLTLWPQSDRQLTLRWDIALRDLDGALDLDADDDGQLTWGELRARFDAVDQLAFGSLALDGATGACVAETAADHRIDRHSDGAYLVLERRFRCPGGWSRAGYRLFALLDPSHRGIVRWIAQDGRESVTVLGPAHPLLEAGPSAGPAGDRLATLGHFAAEGVGHIAGGIDHLLFLACLLIGALLGGGPAPLRTALADVLRIVTAFTAAHSLTLTVAVLGWVALPARWVESGVALTVVIAALDNLVPVLGRRRWLAAFGFGLVHGFAFATALSDLGLAPGVLAVSLAGFNLGVEAGQLAAVGLALPVMLVLRHAGRWRGRAVAGMSAGIALLAGLWFVERAFDLAPLLAGGLV